MSDYYVPGIEEKDLKKVIQSLQQAAGNAATAMDDTTTNTADIATNTAAIAKLTNNQFARVSRITSNQTISTANTQTKVQFNSVQFDPSSIWDAVNFRFKPTVAGYYRVSWSVNLSWSGGTAFAVASVFKNGSIVLRGSLIGVSNPSQNSVGSDILYLDGASDYAEIFGFIFSGTSLIVTAGSDFSAASIELVKAD